jgi:predicted ester cyclase
MSGEAQSLAELRRRLVSIHEGFPDLHAEIQELIAERDLVVARVQVSGTHSGPILGAEASGKHATWTAMVMYRVHDGRIVEQWLNEDWASALQQFGALPEFGA